MDRILSDRVIAEAKYLIETKKTIRDVATHFNVSKSTVHKDMQERLINIFPKLNYQVREILDEHLKIRHIKGGFSTKQKYSKNK